MELPAEPLYDILLNADYQTILNLCQTSSSINHLCQDDYFWQLKFNYDFPSFNKLNQYSWRHSYVLMLQAQSYISQIGCHHYVQYDINDISDIKMGPILNSMTNIIDIDYFNDIKHELPIDNTLQHPTRIIIYIKNNEFYIRYDEAITMGIPRRTLDEPLRRLIRFVNINEYLITYHEAVDFIYVLLGHHIKPHLVKGDNIPMVIRF